MPNITQKTEIIGDRETFSCDCYSPGHILVVEDINKSVSELEQTVNNDDSRINPDFRDVSFSIVIAPKYIMSFFQRIKVALAILFNRNDYSVSDLLLNDKDATRLEVWLKRNREYYYKESNGE